MPWYAYGVSVADVVEASPDADGQLQFVRVVEKSGNRTLRVILQRESIGEAVTFESLRAFPAVRELGCSFEQANKYFGAISVPPGIDLRVVTDTLNTTDVQWEYADPTPEEMGINGRQDDIPPSADAAG